VNVAQFSFIPTAEAPDIADDVRELFADLASRLRRDQRAYSGEFRPALDVLETDEAVEIVVDVAGVSSDAIRVLFRSGVVVIAGEKAPASGVHAQAFHLVEREFGRFARGVRLNGSYDVSRATARVRDGELTIVLPKMSDRRGQAHRIPIE
jgi:HSP20 family protein